MKFFVRTLLLVPRTLLLALCLIPGAGVTMAAQDMLRPAAVVNDEVISMLDLDMRMRLSILATGRPDSPEIRKSMISQVIRRLVDERLQAQEAERLDIKVTEDQVNSAIAEISKRNKMTAESFMKLLQSQNILPEALRDQTRAQVIWGSLVGRRLRPSVEISTEDIEEVVERVTVNRGATQRRLSEIFLAVDTALQEDEIRKNAERLLQELRTGANFSALAQQFSQSATAARGGDLGWVQEGQLPEELEKALATMEPGRVAGPIRTLSGFHILLFHEQQRMAMGEITVDLKQIIFALPENATSNQHQEAMTRAAEVRQRIKGCTGLDDLAKKVGSPGSGDLGTVKISDLPEKIRSVVTTLPIGTASDPLSVAGGVGVLVVCNRTDKSIDRKRIKERLISNRLDLLSRRYMRDLRRNANVDIRI